VAAETGAGWLAGRAIGPVVVAAGSVVDGPALVVVASVVVGATVVVVGAVVGSAVVVGAVVVGAAVLGGTVVVGVVTAAWVVVAPSVDSAWVVVVLPAVAAGSAGPGAVVVLGAPRGNGMLPGASVDGPGEVGGSWEAPLVDADVGAGWVGNVGSAAPEVGGGGGGWWGTRAAEATRAARIAVASPKVNRNGRQGRRGGARCRGRRIGIVASSRFDWLFRLLGCPRNACRYRPQTS
jgi:hypothetical protein